MRVRAWLKSLTLRCVVTSCVGASLVGCLQAGSDLIDYGVAMVCPAAPAPPTPTRAAMLSFTPHAINVGENFSPMQDVDPAIDLNRDGKIDLLLTDGAVKSLFGNGDGTFQDPIPALSMPGGIYARALGDADGDCVPDVISTKTGLQVMPGRGDGTFGLPIKIIEENIVAVRDDLNNDGLPDVATGYQQIRILSLQQNRRFKQTGEYALNSFQLATGDVNSDGKRDLISLDLPDPQFDLFPAQLYVLLGRGDGTFQEPAWSIGSVFSPLIHRVADVNGDKYDDVVIMERARPNATPPTKDSVAIFQGGARGVSAPISFEPEPGDYTLTTADFDGDGHLDLAIPNFGNWFSIRLGNGDGTFQAPIKFTLSERPFNLSVADVNADGRPDVLIYNQNGIIVMRNTSS